MIYKSNFVDADRVGPGNAFGFTLEGDTLRVVHPYGSLIYSGAVKGVSEKDESYQKVESSGRGRNLKVNTKTVDKFLYTLHLEDEKFITIENPDKETRGLFFRYANA
jgi:hypothetical protein